MSEEKSEKDYRCCDCWHSKSEIARLKAEVERLKRDLNHQVYLSDKRKREGVIEGFNAAREMIEGFDPSSNINTSARLKFFQYPTSQDYLSTLDSKVEG